MFAALLCTLCASRQSCEVLSDNCEYCLGNGRDISCGWCGDTKTCLVGTADGPVNHSCNAWTFKFDMKCHLESTESLSLGAKIGITVFTSIVAVGTAVFWICIFPQCANPSKQNQDELQSNYQAHVIESANTE